MPTLPALVDTSGKLMFYEPAKWRAIIARLAGKRVFVSIRNESERHSDAQRNYHWLCCGFVAEVVNSQPERADKPLLDKETLHSAICAKVLGIEWTPFGPTHRSSRKLTTAEYAKLTDELRHECWQLYGVRVPEPGEMDE